MVWQILTLADKGGMGGGGRGDWQMLTLINEGGKGVWTRGGSRNPEEKNIGESYPSINIYPSLGE